MKFSTDELRTMISALGYYIDNVRTRPVETDTVRLHIASAAADMGDQTEIELDFPRPTRHLIAQAIAYTFDGAGTLPLITRLLTDDVAVTDDPFLSLSVIFKRNGVEIFAITQTPDGVTHSATGPTPGHALMELAIHMRNLDLLS